MRKGRCRDDATTFEEVRASLGPRQPPVPVEFSAFHLSCSMGTRTHALIKGSGGGGGGASAVGCNGSR